MENVLNFILQLSTIVLAFITISMSISFILPTIEYSVPKSQLFLLGLNFLATCAFLSFSLVFYNTPFETLFLVLGFVSSIINFIDSQSLLNYREPFFISLILGLF